MRFKLENTPNNMYSFNDILDLLNGLKNNSPVFKIFNFRTSKSHNIDSGNVIKFYKLYIESLSNKDPEEKEFFSLGEVCQEHIPVISDFIFKFENSDKNISTEDDLFESKLVHNIINIHQEIIGDMFSVSRNMSELLCVYLKSEPWIENEKICIRIKFHFPYCRQSKDFIDSVFRKKLITELRLSKILSFFSFSTPTEEWEKLLLRIKNWHPLYGSSEDKKIPPCSFIGVYGPIKDTDYCEEYYIQKIYNYENHTFIKNKLCNFDELSTLVEEDDLDEYEKSIKLLPLFLSLNFFNELCPLRNKEIMYNYSSTTCSEEEENEQENETFSDNPSDMEIFKDLINLLSIKRFNKEAYVLDIGKVLHNITDGKKEGLDIWKSLVTEKGDIYDEEYCDKNYDSFEGENVTIRTIGWYARIDNKSKYEIWHSKWLVPKLCECISENFAEVIVAETFYRCCWLDYMYTGKKWVEFRSNKLVVLSGDEKIRRVLTDKFVPCFVKLQVKNNTEQLRLSESGDKDRDKSRKDLQKTNEMIGKMVYKLLSTRYRNSIIKTACEYFFNETIISMLNKNPKLMGLSNCIIELTSTEAFVRPGKPEDYITKRAGVSYRPEYNYKHKDVRDLLVYFRQVFPEPTLNEHMKKDVASLLYGRNSEKIFRMWIGDTNGSKSVYQKMLRYMLGDYYCDLPPEFFSAQQKSGSGPNPELAQTKGARAVFSAEPDDDMSFKGARIKKVTGGDSFYARDCCENGGTIETSFKPIMVLNIVPDITGLDEATRERFSMVPFEGRWIRADEDVDVCEDIEDQIKNKTYRMDNRFEDNIPRLAGALLWLAVQYYKKYIKEGLSNPPYIKKWMNEYWKKHDPYVSYISENLENPLIKKECKKCTAISREKCSFCSGSGEIDEIDSEQSVTSTEIYPEFKRWFIATHSQKPVPQPKFTDIMSDPKKLGKQHKHRWWGVRIKKKANVIFE